MAMKLLTSHLIPNNGGLPQASTEFPCVIFSAFPEPIALKWIFKEHELELAEYFYENKARPAQNKRSLFYVVQSKHLQCLNGAYLSEVDDELLQLLIPSLQAPAVDGAYLRSTSISTGQAVRQLMARIGQAEFSQAVRDNYQSRCCFPGCTIEEDKFLVGAHIARWADAPDLRGKISNGLCLCLLHDKAFEAGLFTLTDDFRIYANKVKAKDSKWAVSNLLPYDGMRITIGSEAPSLHALALHRVRTKIKV